MSYMENVVLPLTIRLVGGPMSCLALARATQNTATSHTVVQLGSRVLARCTSSAFCSV